MRWSAAAFGVLLLAAEGVAGAQEREPPPVVVIAPPPPEPAPPEPAPEMRPDAIVTPPLHSHGLEVVLGGTTFAPTLDATRFTGAGTIAGAPASFDHKGAEMGLRSPRFYGVELGLAYQRRYFALGLVGSYASARADQGTTLGDVYDTSTIRAWSGAIDLAGAIPAGEFSVRFGTLIGLHAFNTDLIAFDLTTCRAKYGRRPCAETANSQATPFLEPRVRVDWTPGGAAGIVVGAYGGVNVFERPSPTAGLLIGFHFAHGSLIP